MWLVYADVYTRVYTWVKSRGKPKNMCTHVYEYHRTTKEHVNTCLHMWIKTEQQSHWLFSHLRQGLSWPQIYKQITLSSQQAQDPPVSTSPRLGLLMCITPSILEYGFQGWNSGPRAWETRLWTGWAIYLPSPEMEVLIKGGTKNETKQKTMIKIAAN